DVRSGPCDTHDVNGHAGGNTAHNDYATVVTGGNPNDFWVRSPEGWGCQFDGRDLRRDKVVWEVKTGHEWLSDYGLARGSIYAPRLHTRMVEMEAQRIDCAIAAARCGYQYRYAVDEPTVAQALNIMWNGTPPVFCIGRNGTPCT
ncbi:MAG TPA: hypothetical protein VLU41_17405, partial [Ideonella sp.]|nr:hypothetical protein [Ideonella sp.]